MVKRYDCTNGGAIWCQGCYTMKRDDEYGDWVAYEDYAALEEALREIYEVWAGSDGFIPQTASEGYQQKLIEDMVAIARGALGRMRASK